MSAVAKGRDLHDAALHLALALAIIAPHQRGQTVVYLDAATFDKAAASLAGTPADPFKQKRRTREVLEFNLDTVKFRRRSRPGPR